MDHICNAWKVVYYNKVTDLVRKESEKEQDTPIQRERELNLNMDADKKGLTMSVYSLPEDTNKTNHG